MNTSKMVFYLSKSFFSKAEVGKIRDDAKKVFINQMLHLGIISSENLSEQVFEEAMSLYFQKDNAGFINCGKTCQHLIRLHQLSLHQKLIFTLEGLGVNFPNISTRPVIYFNSKHLAKSEVYYKTPAHQDWRSMQGSLNAVVVWVPLVDVNISLGALEIIPKSHLWGLLESEEDEWFRKVNIEKNQFVPVEVEQGDALFFSAFLVHQSGNNRTNSIRWSCHFRYNDLNEKTFIERKYPNPYIYKPQQELVTVEVPSSEQLKGYFLEI